MYNNIYSVHTNFMQFFHQKSRRYLLPRNTEVGQTEKILTVVGSYVIVLLLWLVLRKKEQMRERRKKDEQSIHLKT